MSKLRGKWASRVRERGQALIEFALVVPIFLILVFGIVDFGMGLKAWITITNAAREGARVGAIHASAGTGGTFASPTACSGVDEDADPATVASRGCTTAAALEKDQVMLGVDGADPTGLNPGGSVKVKVTYDYEYITPLGNFIGSLAGGPLHMETSADMRLE